MCVQLSSAGQSTSALGRQPSAVEGEEEEEEEGVAEGVTDTDRNRLMSMYACFNRAFPNGMGYMKYA